MRKAVKNALKGNGGKPKPVTIQRLVSEILTVTIRQRGHCGMIMNRFGETPADNLNKTYEGGSKVKTKRDPVREYKESAHLLPEKKFNDKKPSGIFGFPTQGLIKSMKSAASKGLAGPDMKGTRIPTTVFAVTEFIPLTKVKKMRMRRDLVGGGSSGGKQKPQTISYRAEFLEWESTFQIEYCPNMYSADQIINLINLAGYHIGIGSWRPDSQSPGPHGRFEVVAKQ